MQSRYASTSTLLCTIFEIYKEIFNDLWGQSFITLGTVVIFQGKTTISVQQTCSKIETGTYSSVRTLFAITMLLLKLQQHERRPPRRQGRL